jgi:hypothetical protein
VQRPLDFSGAFGGTPRWRGPAAIRAPGRRVCWFIKGVPHFKTGKEMRERLYRNSEEASDD